MIRVQYWEPAKWTARLRRCNTSDKLIFAEMNMEAGAADLRRYILSKKLRWVCFATLLGISLSLTRLS
jgi:protease II